jgi:hypothetical protein
VNQRSVVPDFRILPWRFYDRVVYKISHPAKPGTDVWVCHYDIYLNERTGELGHQTIIASYRTASFTCWEKKIIIDDREKKLCYVGIYRNGKWEVYRVENNLGKFKVDCAENGKLNNISVSFRLLIDEEITFTFAYLIP